MQRIPHAAELADRRDAPRVEVEGRYSMRLDPGDGREALRIAGLFGDRRAARTARDIALPAQVHVLIGDLAHNARIVWRRGTTVGVDFIDEHHSIF